MSEPAPPCPHRGGFRRCPNRATEPHTCPYAEEVNEDRETLCTCCEDCTRECADDI